MLFTLSILQRQCFITPRPFRVLGTIESCRIITLGLDLICMMVLTATIAVAVQNASALPGCGAPHPHRRPLHPQLRLAEDREAQQARDRGQVPIIADSIAILRLC